MSSTNSLYFDSIHIIESLPCGDRRTGEDLYEKLRQIILDIKDEKLPLQNIKLHQPTDKQQFIDTLWTIADEATKQHHSPILHIEAHGCKSGLHVSSGEQITWTELKKVFTEINVQSHLNLLVVMASCQGAYLLEIVRPTERAPVWALIGPDENITAMEVEKDFSAFYKKFLTTLDGRTALEVLNQKAIGGGSWKYKFIPVRYIFRKIYYEYLLIANSDADLHRRTEEMVAQAINERPELKLRKVELYEYFQSCLRDHQKYFEEFQKTFFMTDLYPNNAARFPLTLEECQRPPRDDPE